MAVHTFNGSYTGDHLNRIAFPLGGIGAGMIGLEGQGGFADLSLRYHPEVFTKPLMFAALCVKGMPGAARVLEGPVPAWRIFGPIKEQSIWQHTGNGVSGKAYGLPRCDDAVFTARFPFATAELTHASLPVQVSLTGWSPSVPGDADASSLPVAAVEYTFTNPTDAPLEAVFSFHAGNVMAAGSGPRGVDRAAGGFRLWQDATEAEPWAGGSLIAAVDDPEVAVDCAWFRGGWFDALSMLWKQIASGAVAATAPVSDGDPSPGGSLYVPFTLGPGATRTIRLRLCWYVPVTDLRIPKDDASTCVGGCCSTSVSTGETHRPWYTSRFADADAVNAAWAATYDTLRARSATFRDALSDTTLPAEVLEAVSANLGILKSPTVLRQADGRLWCFEGSCEGDGCCHGSCTHVWNYAQAIAHLFPDLERTLRETEFRECQAENGHQNFRAWLPIRPNDHAFHAAADGQLGGIMKIYREWRVSGDTAWLRGLWPLVRRSLLYCIDTWDPDRRGALLEPHHNTYDIEFWGADGMCSSFYLGALVAAARMAEALGEDPEPFATLAGTAKSYLEGELFNGEYFVQRIQTEGLHAADPVTEGMKAADTKYSPEALALLQAEGPKYQYGTGCLSDGVLGAWLADVCGLGHVLDVDKLTAHLAAVHRYNLRHDLSDHANPQRPGYALGHEGGLLLCSWPHEAPLSLPFPYSNEVWTGIEYQAAAHLIRLGKVDEGLEIVRTARARHDGRVRNPFDEYECGHWYGRALSSYALLFALTGARYDAVEQTLYLEPRVAGDFRAFFSTATGFGTVGVRDGAPFLDVVAGEIPVGRIAYTPAPV
jgi:uncharacterized protein (DUF608 family)